MRLSDFGAICAGDAMLIADYIAISVLIVLALWAGAERIL
jgi:hypothetical protein